MIQLAKKTSWAEQEPAWILERTPQRLDCGPGQSVGMLGESLLGLAFGFTACRCQFLSPQWLAASLVQGFCKRCGNDLSGKASGLAWTGKTACVYAPPPRIGTSQGSMGRMASSLSSS